MVESPCVKVCKITNSLCEGCHRDRWEIANWTKLSDEEKKLVMYRVKMRKKKSNAECPSCRCGDDD